MAERTVRPPRPNSRRKDGRRKDGRPWSGYTLVMVGCATAVALLILLVPAYLIIRMVGTGNELLDLLQQGRTLTILWNSVILAVSVTVTSVLLAVPLAWLITSSDLPGRRFWEIAAPLPLVIPSYVAAFLYASLLSPKGVVQQLLAPIGIERMPEFYGFRGAYFVLTLMSYPYVYITVKSAFSNMDPALVEAARSLGLSPGAAFRKVTLPYLRPSILASGLLVALYCLRDFGAVTMLQYSTFTRIIYNRYLSYRLDAAAAMALVLVALTAVLLYLEFRARGKAQYHRISIGVARQSARVQLGRWRWPAFAFVFSLVFLALIMPASGLLYWLWRGFSQDAAAHELGLISNNINPLATLLEPAWNSLSASFLAAILATFAALPIAVLAVRRPGGISLFFERLTYASFALPGIVVALAFVFFGTQYTSRFYQTMPMLLAAYLILFLPQAIGAQRASLLQISKSTEEAGRALGHSPLSVFLRITLPLLKPGLIAGGALVFLTCMKELPATLILSPLGFGTLAMDIWSNINEAFFARAAMPTLLLLFLSSFPLALMNLRQQK